MKILLLKILIKTLLVGILTTVANLAAAASYEITDLGIFGGTSNVAYAMNNSGQVVGYSYTAGNASQHAFLYNGGAMTDLGVGVLAAAIPRMPG